MWGYGLLWDAHQGEKECAMGLRSLREKGEYRSWKIGVNMQLKVLKPIYLQYLDTLAKKKKSANEYAGTLLQKIKTFF